MYLTPCHHDYGDDPTDTFAVFKTDVPTFQGVIFRSKAQYTVCYFALKISSFLLLLEQRYMDSGEYGLHMQLSASLQFSIDTDSYNAIYRKTKKVTNSAD